MVNYGEPLDHTGEQNIDTYYISKYQGNQILIISKMMCTGFIISIIKD